MNNRNSLYTAICLAASISSFSCNAAQTDNSDLAWTKSFEEVTQSVYVSEMNQGEAKRVRNGALLNVCEFHELSLNYSDANGEARDKRILEKIVQHPRGSELSTAQAVAAWKAVKLALAASKTGAIHEAKFLKGVGLQNFNVLCEATAKAARQELSGSPTEAAAK